MNKCNKRYISNHLGGFGVAEPRVIAMPLMNMELAGRRGEWGKGSITYTTSRGLGQDIQRGGSDNVSIAGLRIEFQFKS